MMKYIKTYKILESLNTEKEKIKQFLNKHDYDIYVDETLKRDYIINDDLSVDFFKNFNINSNKLSELPFKIGKVNGSFSCGNNLLTSLENGPSEVNGDYICAANLLTSLENVPYEIERDFNCSINKLTSLEFCPLDIGRDLECSFNKLTMLDCSSYVKGNIYCFDMFTEEPEFFGDCEGKIYWEYDDSDDDE